MTGETPDRPAIPETSFDAVRVDRGVRLLLDDAGTVTHVEIDLCRASSAASRASTWSRTRRGS
jgi:hypothetical protein